VSNQFKRFLPFELSGDIVDIEKSGGIDADVVLKYLFVTVGELSDDICNRDPVITVLTISNVLWCVDNTL
jgi:hypothetical protein